MIIYVLEDGETYSGEPAIPVEVTPEQLERIQGGEKVYNVVPDWMEPNDYALCVHCGASHHMDDDHTCVDPDNPDLLMDPVEYTSKYDLSLSMFPQGEEE